MMCCPAKSEQSIVGSTSSVYYKSRPKKDEVVEQQARLLVELFSLIQPRTGRSKLLRTTAKPIAVSTCRGPLAGREGMRCETLQLRT